MPHEIHVRPDGSLELDGRQISIPNVSIRKEIDHGKNGVVLLGTNPVLDRRVAVKLWFALRDNDSRDKYKQGMAEARKEASLELPFIPRIFDAGQIGHQIYTVMEYFDGRSLQSWLTATSPSFAWRYVIAYKIEELVRELTLGPPEPGHWKHHPRKARGIIHGDLHWGNILIHNRHGSLPRYSREECSGGTPVFSMLDEEIELKIVDAGTSYFNTTGFSLSRHWRVYEALIDKLLSPVKMRRIWAHKKPADLIDAGEMVDWFQGYVFYFYFILMHTSENETICPLQCGSNTILTAEGHGYMRGLIDKGQLTKDDIEMMLPWTTLYDYIHSGMS